MMLGDVGRLRTLRSVGLHRSFSRAADELGYTQSAVSQQIAALEQEVGLALVDRGVRPVSLTDAGQLLAGHVEHVLEQLATAEAQLDALRGLRAGRLRVAAFGSALGTFLPTAIARFARERPGVEVTVVEAEPDTSLPLLRAGDVDLAITHGLAATASGDGLDITPLLDDEHRAVLPARHRLAASETVRVRDLAGEAWIVPRADGPARGYRDMLDRLCADAGFAPRIALETHNLQAVQALVAAGLGIALMHDLTMPTRRRDLAVRPLSGPRLTRTVSAVTVAGRRHPAAAAMLEVLTGR
jgi:DNA-binding transcriptional LysR family regulator